MRNNIERDIIILTGSIGVLYIIAKILGIKEVPAFLYIMLMGMVCLIMVCMHMVMYKRFDTENDSLYSVVAHLFSFQSTSIILGLLIAMTSRRQPVVYVAMLFECNLLELLCMPLFLREAGKKINQEQMTFNMAVLFFCAVLISKGIQYYYGMNIYRTVMIGISALLLLSNAIGIYILKKLRWKMSKNGADYLKTFLAARGIYYVLGIYQSLNNQAPNAEHMRWILMYVKFVSMYYMGLSAYYNCLEKSWNQLVEGLRTTTEKIYSNHQDRDTIVNLSHELKTPINVIQSAVQILKLDDRLEKSTAKELQHIRYECNEAMKLITNMIDINKLRGGYLKVQYEVCNVIEAAENIIEAFAIEYKEANLIFNTNEEEVNLKLDINLIQRAGMYIIGTMLNHGRKDIYVDIEYVPANKEVSVTIYATDICSFIEAHDKDVAKCKTEEIGDLLALEFIKRILQLHHAHVIHEGSGCLRIQFMEVKESREEPVFLEDNIVYLREQIKSSYLVS